MRLMLGVVAGVLLVVIGAAAYVRFTGLDATVAPGPLEQAVMGRLRQWATPPDAAALVNPVPDTSDTLHAATEHYADHCAQCHGADGSGETAMGRGLSPRPPDLRTSATQTQADGALFHVIEKGVRFTGMPGFSTGTAEGEAASWALVRLVRRMPQWTSADVDAVRAMEPRPPADVRRELDEERFLAGGE
ncbi:MAG: c-type cytochrome [Vicinamibacterales bacterium]